MTEGQDLILKFTIVNSAGTAINISSGMADLEISVFVKDRVLVQKFVKSLSQITTITAADGTVKVFVDRANLAGLGGRKLYAEVNVIITNSAFQGSVEHTKDIVEIGTLEKAL